MYPSWRAGWSYKKNTAMYTILKCLYHSHAVATLSGMEGIIAPSIRSIMSKLVSAGDQGEGILLAACV